jgi:SAM-dependent methyltransferase
LGALQANFSGRRKNLVGSSTVQGELWGKAAQDWAKLQEPHHLPVWKVMLESAKVGPGTRFFDAGCGGGGASVLAAQRGAHVSGLDASEALISIAQESVPHGDFRVGDLELLPYGDEAFDAIVAALSVQYAADPVLALKELKRVCKSSGYFAISTWDEPEHCDQRVFFEAIRDALPSSPAGGGPFALSAAGALEALIEQAGWKVTESNVVDCPFEYPDLESHWRAQSSAGPLQSAQQVVDEAQLYDAVERAVKPYQTKTGRIRLENRFRYVTATP